MQTIKVRGITFGEGIPKICVPIVGISKEDIVKQAKNIENINIDVVEWRGDWYENIFDDEETFDVLKCLREAIGETPLLFTFRSAREGGEKDVVPLKYAAINNVVIKSGFVDLIDVEAFMDNHIVNNIIENACINNVKVIASSHDFNKTPSKTDIILILKKMQCLDAHVIKLAVMPNCKKDVLTLLEATLEFNEIHGHKPVVTMSMSPIGVISRIVGEVFGSCMTFGSAGKASAPGQIEVEHLCEALQIITKVTSA